MDCMDGNTAAAHVAYALSEFCFIFPITPSSSMAEYADLWSANQKKNCFGTVPTVIQMQSEAGVAGALHGSGASGGLCSSFTSSQGVLLMIPNLYKLSGELIPCVIHLAARQVGTSGTSIYGDHADAMGIRQCGLAMLSSHSPQEVMDLALVAHLSALWAMMPFVHFFDGFQTSHTVASVQPISYETIAKMVPTERVEAHRKRALNPLHPHQRGAVVGREDFFPAYESLAPVFESIPGIVERVMGEVATVTGRTYHLFDYAGAPDAEYVIVAMGAGALAVEETVEYLISQADKPKLGVVRVHLFRPFSVKHFMAAIPASVKRIAVLDRMKEVGDVGDPLYMDVVASVMESGRTNIRVFGGRYGLADHPLTPCMVKSVLNNIATAEPINHYTVGIVDDVMHRSLPLLPEFCPAPKVMACSFWGMGSDGTVGANQMTIKMVGKNTKRFAHGMFFYSTHKSGGVTVSHLRFSDTPVKASYPVTQADFIACSQQSYLTKYPILRYSKPESIVLLNCKFTTAEELEKHIPGSLQRIIATRKLHLFVIDALKIAEECGLGGHTNMIMQISFFKLCPDLMSLDTAVEFMKNNVRTVYAKKGDTVIQKNIQAIDRSLSETHAVAIPAHWASAPLEVPHSYSADMPAFIKEIKIPLMHYDGDNIPVSTYQRLNFAGGIPSGLTKVEKRGIALKVPKWNVDKCVQCTLCSFVCPHASIRPYLLTKEEAASFPQPITSKKATGQNMGELLFRIQVSPLDCTGCGQCINQCPVKALEYTPIDTVLPVEADNWEHMQKMPIKDMLPMDNIKGSQLRQPLFEFSGACAGCGEAPYLKLLTQLFGDRAILGCASGCNVAYGFCFGVNPYTTNQAGRGPATAHSLFEDTAEFVFGIAKTNIVRREQLAAKMNELIAASMPVGSEPLRAAFKSWLDGKTNASSSEKASSEIMRLLSEERKGCPALEEIFAMHDLMPKLSHWAVGGDGWACDIDYGGLDHVLAAGLDMKALVLDTEVYSNTGGQKSKGTPMGSVHKFDQNGKRTHKKDLGLIFMNFENIYVASVALFANPAQTLKAFIEAEAYPGPSLILAYSPCIEHGIVEGTTWLAQTKLAVESGYWPLYRYNPLLKQQGKNPFQLDSPTQLKGSVQEFLSHENRFMRLAREHPDAATALHKELAEHCVARHAFLLKKAQGSS